MIDKQLIIKLFIIRDREGAELVYAPFESIDYDEESGR
jgi:hypothetical protein